MIINVQRFRWLLVVACVTALAVACQADTKKRSKDDSRRTGGPGLPDESGAGRVYELGDAPERPLEPAASDELNRREHRRGPHRPFFDRLPEEERERVSEFLREHFPDETRQLRRIKQSDPDRFEAMLDVMMPEMLRLMRSRDRDPEDVFVLRVQMHKNEFKIRRTLRRHSKTDDEKERAEANERVRELIEQNFDLHQQLMTLQIERLEARIAAIRERLGQREADRDKIIESDLESRLELGPEPPRPHWKGKRGRTPRPPRPADHE